MYQQIEPNLPEKNMSTNYFANFFAGRSSYDSIGESVRVFTATVPGSEQGYLNQLLSELV